MLALVTANYMGVGLVKKRLTPNVIIARWVPIKARAIMPDLLKQDCDPSK